MENDYAVDLLENTSVESEISSYSFLSYDSSISFSSASSQVPTKVIDFVFTSYPQRVFIGILMIIASAAGIFGNTLVILSVIASQKLRTVTNVFVVNLAAADLLVSLFLPWNAVACFAIDGWPLPAFLCTTVAAVLFVCVGCSVYTLASIAFNRWIVITQHDQLFQRIFHSKVLIVWLILTWVIPFSGTVIPPLVGFGQLGYNQKYRTCSSVSRHRMSDEYDILSAAVIYPLPMIVIVVSYVKILIHVRQHSKEVAKHKAEQLNSEGSSCVSHSEESDKGYSSKEATNIGHTRSISETETAQSSEKQPHSAISSSGTDGRLAESCFSNSMDGCNHTNNATIVKDNDQSSSTEISSTNHHHTKSSSSVSKQSSTVINNGTSEHERPISKLPKRYTLTFKSSVRATIIARRINPTARLKRITIIPHLNHRELEITKNMFYIVVVFLVCLTPFAFCLCIDSSDPAIPYAAALVFFNSCLNPVIYAIKHPNFKHIFGLLIKCKFMEIPSPSSCWRMLLQRSCCHGDVTYV